MTPVTSLSAPRAHKHTACDVSVPLTTDTHVRDVSGSVALRAEESGGTGSPPHASSLEVLQQGAVGGVAGAGDVAHQQE